MTQTHRDVLSEIASGWQLPFPLIREVAPCKEEKEDLTFAHLLFGKEPQPTGRWLCTYCDGYLSSETCEGFVDLTETHFKDRIRNAYIQQTCPECHKPIEKRRPVEVMVEDDEPPTIEMATEDTPPLDEAVTFETETKTEYQPCCHRFDRDEELVRWALDRVQLQEDIDAGLFRFDGQISLTATDEPGTAPDTGSDFETNRTENPRN